ncbi:DUF3302 domain-containing protein, partial [Klebsiella quasipneumoniae]|uniref:DUF3302 domain-containing protein n=1 Tax=Klebsiella quasipneumoniae TaxID=1463165 RepID=UPI00211D59D9
MTLDYVALAILIAVALILFYGVIVIHDIPYEIAKERRHPHQDAIHYAGWVSLFTLHALWPLGNDSNLLIVFYVQIVPDDFVMQL